jgi:hypothetical protein
MMKASNPGLFLVKQCVMIFMVEGLGEKEETKSNETAVLKNLLAGATFTELITSEDYKGAR